ncbi:MAG: hypothetical protein E7467_01325 [Ruminococcaceae bacterium]|nr:hypothetical protein [Oscillospiraceae bacterium]
MNIFRLFLTAQSGEVAQEAGMTFAGMSDLMSITLTAILLLSGGYGLYTVIRLRRDYMLFPSKFLYPGDCKPEDCLDSFEFIMYMTPRMAVWSIVMLLMGAAFIVNEFVLHITDLWVNILVCALPAISFIWLLVIQRKAAKRFW